MTKSLELRKDFNTRLVLSLKFFDTLVGGPARIWARKLADQHSSSRANKAAVNWHELLLEKENLIREDWPKSKANLFPLMCQNFLARGKVPIAPVQLELRCSVFNLEIMESGSNIPRDILKWVISKMVWVKLLW